jgi:hypothetical protein
MAATGQGAGGGAGAPGGDGGAGVSSATPGTSQAGAAPNTDNDPFGFAAATANAPEHLRDLLRAEFDRVTPTLTERLGKYQPVDSFMDRLAPLAQPGEDGGTVLEGLLDFYAMTGDEKRVEQFNDWWEKVGETYGFFGDDEGDEGDGDGGGEGAAAAPGEEDPRDARIAQLEARLGEFETRTQQSAQQQAVDQAAQQISSELTQLMRAAQIDGHDTENPLQTPAAQDILALAMKYGEDEKAVAKGVAGTLATADAILKDVYRGPIIEQLNYKTWMLDMIERDSESVDFTGRRAIVPVEATGNESPSSTTDGGTLVDPQIDTEQDAIIAIRYHDGGLELTDALVKQATGNNAGAFVNKLERSSKKLASSMRKNLNRQVFGDGTGLLATLASSPAASTTVTMTETQYLRVNMVVDVLNKTTGATTGGLGLTITGINRTTKVVTLRLGASRRRRPRTASTSRAPATTSPTVCATSPAPAGRCTASTRPRRQRVLERRRAATPRRDRRRGLLRAARRRRRPERRGRRRGLPHHARHPPAPRRHLPVDQALQRRARRRDPRRLHRDLRQRDPGDHRRRRAEGLGVRAAQGRVPVGAARRAGLAEGPEVGLDLAPRHGRHARQAPPRLAGVDDVVRRARVRRAEPDRRDHQRGGRHLLHHEGFNDRGEWVENFIGAYTELDQRIVNLIERIDGQGRGRHDLARELDRLEAQKEREREQQFSETMGERAELLRHALRKDLGAEGSSVMPGHSRGIYRNRAERRAAARRRQGTR